MPIFDILNIVMPVFLVVGSGYLFVRVGWCNADLIDHLMKFAIQLAIPCLLFNATSSINLSQAFDWRVIASYYIAAIGSFLVTYLLARKLFGRRPGESVALGFCALFSNLVLLGLPISERAWGIDSMAPNFALVSVNAPICYLVGITMMEWLRADGRGFRETTGIVIKAMFRNSLMIGIGLGFISNFSGIAPPSALQSAIDLVASASLPVALFALGGVLHRYRVGGSVGEITMIAVLSLFVQPAATLLLGYQFGLDQQVINSIVLMSAIAPGLNAYLFASMYQRGVEIAASTVLVTTILAVFTLSGWLALLKA